MCCKGKVEPERMPPTEQAAYFHGLRVHLQVIHWKLLEDGQLKPEEWRWKIEDSRLNPIMSDKAVAPDMLLKVIRCNCKSTSKAPCSTNICSCGDCHGESCENVQVIREITKNFFRFKQVWYDVLLGTEWFEKPK